MLSEFLKCLKYWPGEMSQTRALILPNRVVHGMH